MLLYSLWKPQSADDFPKGYDIATRRIFFLLIQIMEATGIQWAWIDPDKGR